MASRNRPDLAIKRTHDGVDPTAPGVTRKTAIEPLPDESLIRCTGLAVILCS